MRTRDDRGPFWKRRDQPGGPAKARPHVHLRADRRRGRGTKRGLRDRRAAGNGDYLDVDIDGRLCAWGRDDARFSTGPKCPDPVTDKTVERMAVRVDRLAADAMRRRVVPGTDWTCIVAVIFVRHDG